MNLELLRAALPICGEGYLGTFLVTLVIIAAVKLLNNEAEYRKLLEPAKEEAKTTKTEDKQAKADKKQGKQKQESKAAYSAADIAMQGKESLARTQGAVEQQSLPFIPASP